MRSYLPRVIGLGLLLFVVSSAQLIAVPGAAVAAERAASDKGDTVMYLGSTNKGVIAKDLGIYCDYGGAYLKINKRRTWINVHWMDGSVGGYARQERSTRWLIYEQSPKRKPVLIGSAERKTAMRWDVRRARRLVGHTNGPNGPAAALALLTVCG